MGATKIAQFIENRRKSQNVTQESLAKSMGMDRRSYKRKLDEGWFNEYEICKAGTVLGFDIVFLPRESEVFKA